MRDWLREARQNKGYTMAMLAGELGISESYYCLIEAGARQAKMDLTIASAISKKLEIPLKKIIDEESPCEQSGCKKE